MKKALIIGGGFSGCTAAHLLSLQGGWDVTLVERSGYLGAGVRTFWYGGHPYTFGPRHFLTQNERVFNYLNELQPLRRCADHQFLTYVEQDNAFYNYPIHMDDVRAMPDYGLIKEEMAQVTGVANAKNLEEYWIGSVGRRLYDKFIDKYNKKMWMVDDNKVIDTFNWSPKGVALKDGPRAAWDTAISAYPYAEDGYNKYFDLATADATVLLNTNIDSFDIQNKTVTFNGEKHSYDVIVNTIAPDELFNHAYGPLKFIGRDVHPMVFPTEHVFPEHVYFLYYANSEKFTRMVEYKKFTHHKSPTTLVGLEFPSLNGKHYPLPFLSEIELADRYFADMPEGVFSIGRAGCYRYAVDIDDCIELAMAMVQQLKDGGQDHPVPMPQWRS